jgi:protein-L-isoaspartate(D-aspartate) O-methyltransferase
MTARKDWMESLPKPKAQVVSRTRLGPASAPKPLGLGMTSDARRQEMVRQCQALGVTNPWVLAAMKTIPRHLFVDNALASRAYDDCALPIGHEQTISKPSSVARMLELVLERRDGLVPSEMKALEIGTGCGYQAAVMSQIFQVVYSIERIKALGNLARDRLRPFLLNNVRLSIGDGHLGLEDQAPFDAIVLAAAGQKVPEPLLQQLAVGGLLVAPLVIDHDDLSEHQQALHLVERVSKNDWRFTVLDAARFVPLKAGVI